MQILIYKIVVLQILKMPSQSHSHLHVVESINFFSVQHQFKPNFYNYKCATTMHTLKNISLSKCENSDPQTNKEFPLSNISYMPRSTEINIFTFCWKFLLLFLLLVNTLRSLYYAYRTLLKICVCRLCFPFELSMFQHNIVSLLANWVIMSSESWWTVRVES